MIPKDGHSDGSSECAIILPSGNMSSKNVACPPRFEPGPLPALETAASEYESHRSPYLLTPACSRAEERAQGRGVGVTHRCRPRRRRARATVFNNARGSDAQSWT